MRHQITHYAKFSWHSISTDSCVKALPILSSTFVVTILSQRLLSALV
jgi:hypothetical protein